ncbi:MAG: deoxyribodipyrimidine photo-lyase, partial [Actinomycetota bacterium]|nr:deoxyribodipyrimidine photo-lyase [Actinomycetota bacterium]
MTRRQLVGGSGWAIASAALVFDRVGAFHTWWVSGVGRGPGVVWFRRDLRLGDNPAWAAATAAHDEVVALFVVEPGLMRAASPIGRDWLLAQLLELDARLGELGGGLVVRSGPALLAVPRVVAESDAAALYVDADVTPYSTRRDRQVTDAVSVRVAAFGGVLVHEPGAVLTRRGALSQVFTPFYRTWCSTPLSPWPSGGDGRPVRLASDPIPEPGLPPTGGAGELSALQRLAAFVDVVDDYADLRDLLAVAGTSGLSADLKFGTLAARTVVETIGEGTPGSEAFVRQLCWRDWWAHILRAYPDLARVALREPYRRLAWRDDPEGFERWCAGRTGYPIVDAGMRQLTQTGWMHNRVHMICASFLVKDLLVDWRKGEGFFRRHLVDGDVAQNAGNWQWVAGTGPDAAPYFRVFN